MTKLYCIRAAGPGQQDQGSRTRAAGPGGYNPFKGRKIEKYIYPRTVLTSSKLLVKDSFTLPPLNIFNISLFQVIDNYPLLPYTDIMTDIERKKRLTPVQAKFVDEYLKDPSDGGLAYMRAAGTGNKKSAAVQASKLLKMDKVQEALKQRAEDILGPVYARILKNVEFWLDVRDNEENRTADRMKASEYLGKYMQMFIDKKEVDMNVGVTIVDDIK